MTKTLYIMVGLPGSGKSTWANLQEAAMDYIGAVICSADHWFERTGEYIFKPEELGQAHAFCKGRADGAMQAGHPCVIIDNTNLTHWERSDYLTMAEKYDYRVQIKLFEVTPEEAAVRNSHGVPLEACKRMQARFNVMDLATDIDWAMKHNAKLKAEALLKAVEEEDEYFG